MFPILRQEIGRCGVNGLDRPKELLELAVLQWLY